MEDLGDSERFTEAREGERAAAKHWARTRTLVGLVGEAVSSGDEMTVVSGDHRFSGVPTAAVGDHAVLERGDRRALVNLSGPIHLRRATATAGGAKNDRSHGTFVARLRTLELQEATVEVVASSGAVSGQVLVAGSDHVVLISDGYEVAIPNHTIAWVTYDVAYGG